MQEIKDFLKEKGIYPKVDFDDKLPHIVRILKSRIVEYDDGSSTLKLLVEEKGEYKIITAPSVLVEIQDCQMDDVYKIQMKYKKMGDKPIRYYEVEKISKVGKIENEKTKDEIPVIEEGEGTEGNEPPEGLFD